MITYNLETKEIKNPYVIDQHNGPITGCSIHPIGYLAACCSKDGTWSFHDLNEVSIYKIKKKFKFILKLKNIKYLKKKKNCILNFSFK